jgi:hypothetical protein
MSGAPSSSAGTGSSGPSVGSSGTYSGAGSTTAMGGAHQQKLDRAVQAYRDCLQR